MNGLELKIKTIGIHVGTGPGSNSVLGKADLPGDKEVGSFARIFQITGSFVATLKLEGSLDGIIWHDWICDITVGGFWLVNSGPFYMRSNCTSYTSGTATVKVQTIVKGF